MPPYVKHLFQLKLLLRWFWNWLWLRGRDEAFLWNMARGFYRWISTQQSAQSCTDYDHLFDALENSE
jgi:hypothetical protein